MKKYSLIFILFFCACQLVNSQSISSNVSSNDPVVVLVQKKARPKEGLEAFYKSFIEKFNSSKQLKSLKNVDKVSIKLRFIVEKDGSFSNLEVNDDKYNLGKEAIRVMKEMPNWEPAMHEGNLVRSSFTLPIGIKIDNENLKSEEIFFKNERKIAEYLTLLNTNTIHYDLFSITCNCEEFSTKQSNEHNLQEFFLKSKLGEVWYSIILKEADLMESQAEMDFIKQNAINNNVSIEEISLNGYNGLVFPFLLKEEVKEEQLKTMFLSTDRHLIVVTIKSTNQQLTKLTFDHLLKNFKLN